MLPGAGFGDDPPFAHAPREQRLAECIVDLVRAGMQQVFALEIDLCPAAMPREALGEIERGRAAGVIAQILLQLGLKRRVLLAAA